MTVKSKYTIPKCPIMTQNVPAWPQMAQNISQGHNTWLYDILGHPGAFWEAQMAPVGLWKGPMVVQHDTVSCNIPMVSVLGPFGVIQGHFGSWRAIFGHEGPFVVLFWAIMGPQWASEKGPGWSNMTYNHVIYPLEVFRVIWSHAVTFWAILVILSHSRPFWCCFGPFWGPRGHLNGPRVVQHDI